MKEISLLSHMYLSDYFVVNFRDIGAVVL